MQLALAAPVAAGGMWVGAWRRNGVGRGDMIDRSGNPRCGNSGRRLTAREAALGEGTMDRRGVLHAAAAWSLSGGRRREAA